VTTPHEQRRDTSRCSTTHTVIFGMSNTCRRIILVGGPSAGSALPQPAQAPGSCTTTSSGRSTCRSVRPWCPGCPPGSRPDRPRSDLGAGLSSPSLDGGFDEFREEEASCRSSSAMRASCSTIRASCAARRASCTASRSCSWAMVRACAATSAVSCSRTERSPTDPSHPTAIIRSGHAGKHLNSHRDGWPNWRFGRRDNLLGPWAPWRRLRAGSFRLPFPYR